MLYVNLHLFVLALELNNGPLFLYARAIKEAGGKNTTFYALSNERTHTNEY